MTKDPIKSGRNWYVYCDNNPLKRADPSGLGWHDPGIVYVDPGFKGKVIVIGEDQGSGDDQVYYELGPGQHSNPHVDVDVIIVIDEDGNVSVYAFWGRYMPGGLDVPQLAIVHKDGSVTGPNVQSWNAASELFSYHAVEHLKGSGEKYPPRNGVPNMGDYFAGLNPGTPGKKSAVIWSPPWRPGPNGYRPMPRD